MKLPLYVFAYLASGGTILAQCPFGISERYVANLSGADEAPANNSPYVGSVSLSLCRQFGPFEQLTLSYSTTFSDPGFLPLRGGIYGPGEAGQRGPLIFDFGGYSTSTTTLCVVVWGSKTCGDFSGDFAISSQQAAELQAGKWYVNVTSADYPDGELRGQIVTVPEPGIFSQVGFGGVVLVGCLALRRCVRKRERSARWPKQSSL